MIITAWILFIFFGFFTFVFTVALFTPSIKDIKVSSYIFYVVMTAIFAGVIWGGLFQ